MAQLKDLATDHTPEILKLVGEHEHIIVEQLLHNPSDKASDRNVERAILALCEAMKLHLEDHR